MNIEDLGRRIESHQGSMTLTTCGYDLFCDFKAGYDEQWKDGVLLDFKPHDEPPMFKEFRAFAKRMEKKYNLGLRCPLSNVKKQEKKVKTIRKVKVKGKKRHVR